MLKMFESIANQVNLVQACLGDISGFMSFMFLFIITIASSYKLCGANFDDEDYPNVPDFFVYLMQTFRNSFGDIVVPTYRFWN